MKREDRRRRRDGFRALHADERCRKGFEERPSNIDKGVISTSVEEHWLTIMLTCPDLARGDCKIIARASEYLIQQEQLQMRRKEFLDATNNPTDFQIMGIDGRSELLRENAKALKMDPSKIVPDREDMIARQVEQQLQQFVMKLAQALKVAPEQLIAILQAPAPGGRAGNGGGGSQELDAAGNPVAGTDVRMFSQ